jgi:hypothetical protein
MCSSGASVLSTNGLMKQPASQLGEQTTPTKSLVITRTDAFFNLHLSDCVLSRIIRSPFRPMGERAIRNVITKVAPPKAQHPQPLRLKNYWRRQIWRELDQPTTEGARNASCNLSGTKDRWAQHETVLRLFHF